MRACFGWTPAVSAEKRREVWQALLLDGLDTEENYTALSKIPCSYDDVIRRDIGRTLPQEELFRANFGKGQSALFRLLRALAVQSGDIGYVQSLNFVVATLINVFPDDEELAFSCARSFLFRHGLADLYRPMFPKLGVAIWQFDRLVEGFLPEAHAALEEHGISAEFYAMQWFLTLFAGDLPQKVVVRIWDQFLVVGWQAIVQVALALVSQIQKELNELETCEAMKLLKKFTHTRKIEADSLLEAASKFEVSHRMLSDLEAAHDRGEDPEGTRLVFEEDGETGKKCWSVQRRVPPKLQRSNSTRSVGSNSEPLPRAFSQENLHAKLQGEGGKASPNSAKETDGSTNKKRNGLLLPFIIHNLDTGETSVLEEEWCAYMQEENLAKVANVPNLLSQRSWHLGSPKRSQPRISGACGGSFWMQGRQMQALHALGKA
jgi:hypothetical protein